MLEAELAFLSNVQDLCACVERFVHSVVNHMLEVHGEELEAYRRGDKGGSEVLETIRQNAFIRMSYSAAVTVLARNGFQVNTQMNKPFILN